jgi:hypothetical protein
MSPYSSSDWIWSDFIDLTEQDLMEIHCVFSDALHTD